MSHTKMALNEKTTLQPTTTTPADTKVKTGLEFQRHFTDGRTSPFDTVEWERRVAQIGNEKGIWVPVGAGCGVIPAELVARGSADLPVLVQSGHVTPPGA